jgi:hypothetical protein
VRLAISVEFTIVSRDITVKVEVAYAWRQQADYLGTLGSSPLNWIELERRAFGTFRETLLQDMPDRISRSDGSFNHEFPLVSARSAYDNILAGIIDDLVWYT